MEYINPLKIKYPVVIRITGLIGIGLVIINFLIFPRFQNTLEFEDVDQIIIENIDIPQTQQIDNTPPPARPSIPVPSDDEDIDDDITLDELDFDDFSNMDAPPPPPSGPKVAFIPYDLAPRPKSAIRPIYPEIAQEAGIEGVVVVQAFIDANGRVKETIILKGVPNTGLDEAAMEAIRKTKFQPAEQRERPVAVWISIPVNFRLK
jgi:periplasmic protein TonB